MSARTHVAPQPGTDYKPAYVVQELEGTVKVNVHTKDKDAGIVVKQVEVPAGYMVSFPRGHSIRVKDHDELKRLGFDVPPPLVDLKDESKVN